MIEDILIIIDVNIVIFSIKTISEILSIIIITAITIIERSLYN